MSPNYFLSPNSLSWLSLISFFFISHIMIDNNDFYLVLVVSFVKKIFQLQIEPIFDLCPNHFCLQIHILTLIRNYFSYFAYYYRPQWSLFGTSGFSRLNFFGLNLDLSPNYLCLQIRFIDLGSLTFCFLTFLYYFVAFYLLFIT